MNSAKNKILCGYSNKVRTLPKNDKENIIKDKNLIKKRKNNSSNILSESFVNILADKKQSSCVIDLTISDEEENGGCDLEIAPYFKSQDNFEPRLNGSLHKQLSESKKDGKSEIDRKNSFQRLMDQILTPELEYFSNKSKKTSNDRQKEKIKENDDLSFHEMMTLLTSPDISTLSDQVNVDKTVEDPPTIDCEFEIEEKIEIQEHELLVGENFTDSSKCSEYENRNVASQRQKTVEIGTQTDTCSTSPILPYNSFILNINLPNLAPTYHPLSIPSPNLAEDVNSKASPLLSPQIPIGKSQSFSLNFEALESQNTQQKSSNRKFRNFFDVLSTDITFSQTGFKILNNVSKIGTESWLQAAINNLDHYVKAKKKEEKEVVEVDNEYSSYIDYNKVRAIRRFYTNKVKICRIIKLGTQRNSNCEMTDEQQYENIKPSKLGFEIDNFCQDQELIHTVDHVYQLDKDKIRYKIHDIFSKLYNVAQNHIPSLVFRGIKGYTFKNGKLDKAAPKLRRMTPRLKNNGSIFCKLLYIMGKIYTLLETDKKLTKREIFYQAKRFFKTQGVLDLMLTEVTRLLDIGLWDLNIIVNKGLVFGNLKFFWVSGEVTDCNSTSPLTLIPHDLEDLVEIQSTAYFILVVEKESIFRKLLEENLPNKLARPFIMITGKGVPDVNTRRFLKKISSMLALPVFILVDPDIYGIKIMLHYRIGSIANHHLSEHLAVPNARWLGVFPSEIPKFGMPYQKLTQRDVKLTKSFLKQPFLQYFPKIVKEVTFMLTSKKKASIEGLIKNSTFLSEAYLPTKFFNRDFV